jgi:hypothetical protein
MLSSEQRNRIYCQAYLPEHLPGYVEAISGAQAHLVGNYLCFTRKAHLIFIGYPLGTDSNDTARAYSSACEQFEPSTVALIAPDIPLTATGVEIQSRDCYYRCRLPLETVEPKTAYMVRRAQRELTLSHGSFQKEHKKLIKTFLQTHQLTAAQAYIYQHIDRYLKHSATARILETRRQGVLAAFTVVDTGSADYAFYLFNFRSQEEKVPGASDLLFKAMLDLAQSEGKKTVNLGLGIHQGIRRFKQKWGGEVFLPYLSAWVDRKTPGWGELAQKL